MVCAEVERLTKMYKLKAELGTGAFSAVRKLDKSKVVVKLIKARRQINGENLEVILMRRVSDLPGVIKLLEHFSVTGCYCIITEEFKSENLFDFITENGPLCEWLCRVIFKQLLETVIQCHKRGVFHRDVKVANILINLQSCQIKLVDFGCGAYSLSLIHI